MWFAERKELNICFSEKNLRLKTEDADTNARSETYAQAVERGSLALPSVCLHNLFSGQGE